MIFRQLYDATSSTYTYLLADEHSREALLIDPVFEQQQRDLALLDELGLTLKLVVDTHAHADHITAAWLLKQKTGCTIASAAVINAEHVDLPLQHGQHFGVQGIDLQARATPGHTDGCMSYVLADQSMVFTGDTLLIRGCGRSDFQQGNASTLYRSITEQLFSLPDSCAVYPAHDYHGRTRSSIGEEKQYNARVGGGANETDFVGYMQAMQLPHPKKIDEAVPANLRSGCPEDGQLPPQANWADLRITFAGVPEVEPEWLIHNQPSVTLLDVRQPEEVIDGECPSALQPLHIPLDQLRQRIADVPADKPIIALCRSGRRSAMAVSILQEQGLERVASLRGGLLRLNQ
ncbi:MBL fold metallo-hydrolase [Halopseudomonas yangmingensis]|uniref:Glyoxylase, beta-lactamase superfamily II n=1 Tax=Halopseudomonas yangmingensis TaxID=1720063 RepID=A0A1I4S1T0_9GAMM|nr:MBL fold metallo-hydrolase [Halopseudomonas yangmingensis]SFM58445.1 Glyoxylase, beta-lactamase superfamily II [Halopseudomonas yangmingensis]